MQMPLAAVILTGGDLACPLAVWGTRPPALAVVVLDHFLMPARLVLHNPGVHRPPPRQVNSISLD